eukprot:CAMPEP_0175890526 /NCGR_PEP_ID=MMETSP0107_2-20121207/47858_1 /TAXON_ID=195067 ORGANISM="Goniomonas pacifica, Strain CCMP1869" /NCGR_SAMPLE_ID=MMETSP0107_2 /ASSEMBLY_ACC=CAM_ASM_000203 /LENGTH=107 /DNA_ID=CAMNT_0017211263 /DNA_START=116 /DNA_END=439 /DNA_ORIENTATION=-
MSLASKLGIELLSLESLTRALPELQQATVGPTQSLGAPTVEVHDLSGHFRPVLKTFSDDVPVPALDMTIAAPNPPWAGGTTENHEAGKKRRRGSPKPSVGWRDNREP